MLPVHRTKDQLKAKTLSSGSGSSLQTKVPCCLAAITKKCSWPLVITAGTAGALDRKQAVMGLAEPLSNKSCHQNGSHDHVQTPEKSPSAVVEDQLRKLVI